MEQGDHVNIFSSSLFFGFFFCNSAFEVCARARCGGSDGIVLSVSRFWESLKLSLVVLK